MMIVHCNLCCGSILPVQFQLLLLVLFTANKLRTYSTAGTGTVGSEHACWSVPVVPVLGPPGSGY